MSDKPFCSSFQEAQTVEIKQFYEQFFKDALIFDQISSYLHISDLLQLCQVNKLIHEVIQKKCKKIILSHKMLLIPSKTAIHQMRFYFDRCLTIYKKNDQNISNSLNIDKKQKTNKVKNQQEEDRSNNYTLIRTIKDPFKYKTITNFEVGVVFTVCQTIDNQAFIYKTAKIINPASQITKNDYKKLDNIKQIKVKSEHITYLNDDNQIYRLYGMKADQDKIIQKAEQASWSINIPIQEIEASFNYTIFRPKHPISYEQFCKFVLGYDIDLGKKQTIQHGINHSHQDNKTDQNTRLILFNNITQKYNLIQFNEKLNFTQIVVGRGQAYLLTQNYECFVCYFQDQNNLQNNELKQTKIIKGKRFVPFQTNSIVKISSGYNFYMALQRQIHNVEKWTIEQVCRWVRQIGFPQFTQIFMVEKVNGKKLLAIDKNYMYSNLGITKPNMQQKFLMLLEQVVHNKNKVDTLYGWGKNQNGQLGSRNANYIKQPQKIRINCIKQNQYIDSIFCEWFLTFIRTQKGRIYRTINQNKKKNKQKQREKNQIKQKQKAIDFIETKKPNILEMESGDEQFERKNTNKNNHKKKRKYTHDMMLKKQHASNHKKFEQDQKWLECEQGKAFFIRAYKDFVFYVQCPSQKQFEPTKQKKLRTAKMLLNKIIWSFQPDIQELYKIGYIDKDMGLIEITIKQLRMFDFNQNRIKYFKKNQLVIWDRESKIDNFN